MDILPILDAHKYLPIVNNRKPMSYVCRAQALAKLCASSSYLKSTYQPEVDQLKAEFKRRFATKENLSFYIRRPKSPLSAVILRVAPNLKLVKLPCGRSPLEAAQHFKNHRVVKLFK
ncbi:MAG: hypothetical protein MRY21_06045 [Simkaniaceae bacterium]|nr:hypothetical protein [Simkaniaceae bacterium]